VTNRLDEVPFLGHIISKGGILVDPAKVTEIEGWKIPSSVTKVRSFLGLAGYYQCFIDEFSNIAKHVTSLLEKGKQFKWTHECQESFNQLRFKLMLPPVLIMPDLQKGFGIYCDACAGAWDVFLCKRDMSSPTRLASCGNMS
jgi:hypothetical protein